MKCPVCDVDLSISSREGVEIDFCPQCRGVWLDRGELDKIIERVGVTSPAAVPESRDDYRRDDYRRDDRDYRYDDDRRHDDDHRGFGGRRKKKRGSFLEDLFDFD